MTDPVRAYYDSWKDGIDAFDEAGLRAALAPDLDFEGTLAGHRVGAEGFVRGVLGFVRLLRGFRVADEVSDDGGAAVLYDCELGPERETLRFAEFFTVAGGRITRLRLHYDGTAFRRVEAAAAQAPTA